MFLADYHLHCAPYSPDARDPMERLVEAAVGHGLTHICITNHVDNCSKCVSIGGTPFYFDDWPGLITEFADISRRFGDKIDLRLGAELSTPHYIPEIGRELYEKDCLDFVIGSVHNLRGRDDFYFYDYPENFEELRPTVEEYLTENIALARSHLCDVLGHLGYLQRYMAKQGKFFDMMEFEELLRALFAACVESGVGIEVNTSGLQGGLGRFLPDREVLTLYRELGGEIITVGSDSHEGRTVGRGVQEAYGLLKECGFQYVCLFKKHKPEFIQI